MTAVGKPNESLIESLRTGKEIPMRIGLPKEIKPLEGRIALVPEAVAELVQRGHRLLVERGAGERSGFSDAAYRRAGAELVDTATDLFGGAELIVKVKEPLGPELELLRPGHCLFGFLHLAAEPPLMERLCAIGLTALAFETLQDRGRLPILAPMSQIAGRLAVQIGATLLLQPNGGKGRLLGGLAGTERGRVVVLGAGNVGSGAVEMAAGMGALVTVFDRNPDKQAMMRALGANVTARYPYVETIGQAIAEADLLVGAVLVPGARAPRLVSRAQVAAMEPGSVVVDVAVDQGGCVETTRPTSYEQPTYVEEGVVHFGVTNMPGAVPRTASVALSAALMPYLLRLMGPRWREDTLLQTAINLDRGAPVYPALQALVPERVIPDSATGSALSHQATIT